VLGIKILSTLKSLLRSLHPAGGAVQKSLLALFSINNED
jgi:hypothetical protein